MSKALHAIALQTIGLGKRFGSFVALEDVNLKLRPGSVHALLGENGAGKSTLVKCLAGFHQADAGAILIDEREHELASPQVARAMGIGMVYQHFTLAPNLSVAENLLLAGPRTGAIINWTAKQQELRAFLQHSPFRLDLQARPVDLSAGEKQKLELLKQLFLRPRLLILDEPTSVLTPQEADEVLAYVRTIAHQGQCSVLLITHKFREVRAYADDVTVLRRGRLICSQPVAHSDDALLAQAMVGEAATQSLPPVVRAAPGPAHEPQCVLAIKGLSVQGDRGEQAVRTLDLQVQSGEILGIAGVAGNGQRELMQALVGQRPKSAGRITVLGQEFRASRAQNQSLKVRSLPEEPLRNACVAALSVAENMALRDFDCPPLAYRGLVLRPAQWRLRARSWIQEYGIKTRSETAAMHNLSGGNVQRAVLARELAGQVNLLIACNPSFGLDFAAVEEIHRRLRAVRERGGAVLLISEDLDELLLLADRLLVMSAGRSVHACTAAQAQRHELGAYMGGGLSQVAA